MLKIKDNVDLKELEKFGYKKGEDIMCCSYNAYGKIYEQQLDSVLNVSAKGVIYVVEIDEKSKGIELNVTTRRDFRSFAYTRDDIVKPYIQDLIQAGLVERVEDKWITEQ